MSLTEAIRELRAHTGKSQQIFATELGMSISALQKYEYGDTPGTQHLLRLWGVAATTGRGDLAEVIYREIQDQIIAPPGFSIEFHIRSLKKK